MEQRQSFISLSRLVKTFFVKMQVRGFFPLRKGGTLFDDFYNCFFFFLIRTLLWRICLVYYSCPCQSDKLQSWFDTFSSLIGCPTLWICAMCYAWANAVVSSVCFCLFLCLLSLFTLIFHFCTPWKRQKTGIWGIEIEHFGDLA